MFKTIFTRLFIILSASYSFSSLPALASSLPQPPTNVPSFADDTLIDKNAGFNAIVRLERADGGVCSGVAIRTNDNPNSPAFVVSAGHCYGLTYGEVVTNQVLKGDKKTVANFKKFHDAGDTESFTINVKKASYATMRGHDISIFELNTTQGKLAARGILLPKLASSLPSAGLNITTYGSRADNPLVRAINCTLKNRVNLSEGRWLWWDVLRTDCAKTDLITGGASGSPVYLQGTASELFGILNTVNNFPSVNVLCSENNPCELKPPRAISRLKSVYVMEAHLLRHCFTPAGEFNYKLKLCPLPKQLAGYTELKRKTPTLPEEEKKLFNQQLRYPNPAHAQTPYVYKATSATKAYQAQLLKPAKLSSEAYRYKLTPLANFNPTDPSGYSEPTRKARIEFPYPSTEGSYILSVIPVKNYNLERLNPLALYTDIFEVVHKNPVKLKKVTVTGTEVASLKKVVINKLEGDKVLINSLVFLAYKIGPKASTNCADFKKYTLVDYVDETYLEPINSGDKLCLSIVDRALNASEPYEYLQP